jgi:hypothetical protein
MVVFQSGFPSAERYHMEGHEPEAPLHDSEDR